MPSAKVRYMVWSTLAKIYTLSTLIAFCFFFIMKLRKLKLSDGICITYDYGHIIKLMLAKVGALCNDAVLLFVCLSVTCIFLMQF